MTGAAWAAGAGILFGLFQALSVQAVRRAVNVTLVTFVQVTAAAVVIGVVAVVVEGLRPLVSASAYSLLMFALAGVVHFFVGWIALNRSQSRIGAARTAPLIATSPAFGVVVALLVYGELPGVVALVGIAATMVGAYVLTDPGAGRRAAFADSGWGLTTAAAWALSAVLTVRGLADFPYPLLGVAIGMVAAAVPFGVLLLVGSAPVRWSDAVGDLPLKVAAGSVVAIGTWWRWLGLDQAPVGVVLALNLLSVPSVLVFAPLLARRGEEVVTGRLVAGTGVVLGGALTLVLA
ncbi:MAG TPA: EamA family transporter [Nocardioidaceae bacterium]|nr:EamA family transporter [Nocardioidaceae bacterium]